MKTALITSIILFTRIYATYAQGSINFANLAAGVNAPVTNAAGNLIVGPNPYVADLFWSDNTNASLDDLMATGLTAVFSTNYPGYFFGGVRTFPGIPTILVQVRVWDSSYGQTYFQARDNGGEFGFSNPFLIVTSAPPGTPTNLTPLEGFQLQRLPLLAATLTRTNTIVFSWPVEQTAYAVQQNPDLSPNNWVTLPNTPVTVGQQQQVIVPVPSSGRIFYRLVSQ